MISTPTKTPLFPYTTLFRSGQSEPTDLISLESRALDQTRAQGIMRCWQRSEEHTSELQSRPHLVCRLLLEKKKQIPVAVLIMFATPIHEHLTSCYRQTHLHL